MFTLPPTDTLQRISRQARTASTILELNYKLASRVPKKDLAQWFSKRIEQLGPTYIKFGQFASNRRDIFGDEFADALATLRDRVTPMTDQEVQHVFATALDTSKFSKIDMKPIASASIGQVHRATLKNGKDVIVKIKRPDVGRMIKDDVQFLLSVLSLLQFFNLENIQDTIDIIMDFERNISKEVDFVDEIRNLEKFKDLYGEETNGFQVTIPNVYTKLSTDNAIVMDYIPSKDVNAFKGDKKELARRMMDFFIHQLVVHGYIHGDPHSGNIGTNPQGELVIYDFGNVITISDGERQRLKELIYYLLVKNKNGVITTLKKLGIKILDEQIIYDYIDLYIDYLRTIDIKKLSASSGPTVKLPLKLNDKVFRLTRVYGILEGICKELDPDFNYIGLLQKYTNNVFFDEEFILYKIAADTSILVNNFLDPLDKQVDSQPLDADQVRRSKKTTEIVDKKHTAVMLDNNLMQVLLVSNVAFFAWNILHGIISGVHH